MVDNTGNIKNYRVVKPIAMSEGTIPVGGDITLVFVQGEPTIYYQNGLLPPSYQADFHNLILKEERYGFDKLKPMPTIYNKI